MSRVRIPSPAPPDRLSSWRRQIAASPFDPQDVRPHPDSAQQTAQDSGVRIGLFTDGLKDLSRREAFAWAADHDITDVEMSVGTWGARTHLDLEALLREPRAVDDLRRDLDESGIRVRSG